MTNRDILAKALLEVTGKTEKDGQEILDFPIASRLAKTKGLLIEVPDDEAQKQIEVMRSEGPSLLTKLMQGAFEFTHHDGKTGQ